MLPALATLADMEARLGHAITDVDERARATALLDDASALVRWATHDDFVDENGALVPLPDIVVTTTAQSALRGWYNPAALEEATLGAVTVRYGGAWLTANEKQMLGQLVSGGSFNQLTLQPGFGWGGAPYGYVPVDNDPLLSTPDADWFPIGY